MANHTPGVNLAQGDVEPLSNVLHRLVAFGDDAHTFSDGFGRDGVVSGDHDHLSTERGLWHKRKLMSFAICDLAV